MSLFRSNPKRKTQPGKTIIRERNCCRVIIELEVEATEQQLAQVAPWSRAATIFFNDWLKDLEADTDTVSPTALKEIIDAFAKNVYDAKVTVAP